MKIKITKKGIRYNVLISDDSLWSLYCILEEFSFPIMLKDEIEEDISHLRYITYTFNNSGFIILNKNLIELICLPDEEKFRLKLPINTFWDALFKYEKLYGQEYKKMTINFDGTKVYFELEK